MLGLLTGGGAAALVLVALGVVWVATAKPSRTDALAADKAYLGRAIPAKYRLDGVDWDKRTGEGVFGVRVTAVREATAADRTQVTYTVRLSGEGGRDYVSAHHHGPDGVFRLVEFAFAGGRPDGFHQNEGGGPLTADERGRLQSEAAELVGACDAVPYRAAH
jgi:hypothetical protein